eukprot:GEMP01011746.1.p1 GENE.GEMP01011746.1~~GEMP01011746.1.p1  ORF type:complete len:316 (-),score=111.01 GEMP01011746.1:2261-3169(-)
MATVDKSLGDFFANKKKKKIKAVNLNAPKKEDDEADKKKKVKEEKKDGDWDDTENKEQPAPKSELGNLAKEEEDGEEKEAPKPAKAWGTKPIAPQPAAKSATGTRLGDTKKFPSLAASTSGMPISTMVGRDGDDPFAKPAAKKNLFAELEGSDSDEDKPARSPGLASKKQGEKDVRAINTSTTTGDAVLDKEAAKRKVEKSKKKEEKKEKRQELKASREEAEPKDDVSVAESELPPDCLIKMDGEAARLKYVGRRKLPCADLPMSELKEEKVQRKKLKVHKVVEEEEKKKNLLVLDEADDGW